MTLYVRNSDNTAWVEFPTGPRIFAYNSSPAASANPWQRVYEIRTGASLNSSLWTLSDPVTYTFDATVVNTLRNEEGTVSTSDMNNPEYDRGTRWVRSGFTIGRGTMFGGRSSSVENGKMNVGVASVFIDPNAPSGQPNDLKTIIQTAMQERPVIKSVVLSVRRKAENASSSLNVNDDTVSGTVHTFLYKGIATLSDSQVATAKYALADVSAAYAASASISTTNWELYKDLPITTDTFMSVMNNDYSIGFAADTAQANWSLTSGSSGEDRIEWRGPSTGGAIGLNRPTLKVTLDYY